MQRLLGIAVVLAACSESTEERLDRFKADADVACWEYFGCASRYGQGTAPSIAIEQGVACMNDALASGVRATASWGVADAADDYGFRKTFVFTVDQQVKVFKSYQYAGGTPDVQEEPSCTGPFRIAEQSLCGYISAGFPVAVNALAWDGCP